MRLPNGRSLPVCCPLTLLVMAMIGVDQILIFAKLVFKMAYLGFGLLDLRT